MTDSSEIRRRYIQALAKVASRWSDPDHPSRAAAVEQTLSAENRFTEEAVAFAVNQQTAEFFEDNLRSWTNPYPFRDDSRPVAVLNAGNVPFIELQDFAAVILTGNIYRGIVSSRSPYLITAFVREIKQSVRQLPATFVPFDAALEECRAVIASGSDETMSEISSHCQSAGIPRENLLLRGTRFAVAILDGREGDEERSGLAEDLFLHEGAGCRNVAVVWAPRALDPDPYLDAIAQFRDVFPPHEATPGTLTLPRALLAAADRPHAYGDGFLVSKGDPEAQMAGHARWAEYDDLAEVEQWLAENRHLLQGIVSSEACFQHIKTDLPRWNFGEAQRPDLTWHPDGIDTLAFLSGIDR